MENNRLTVKATLDLDANWASNHTPDELAEYLKLRLNHALGFRGFVKKVKTVKPKVALPEK